MPQTVTPGRWEAFARYNRLDHLARKVRPYSLRLLHEVSLHGAAPHMFGVPRQAGLTDREAGLLRRSMAMLRAGGGG